MRWQELFADLEAQLVAEARLEQAAEVPDRTRRERADVSWLDRAARSAGTVITCATAAGVVRGALEDLGREWLLVQEQGRHAALLPTAAVLSVTGLSVRSDDDRGMGRRFGLGVALRAIARDRAPVAVHDIAGGLATGTIDRVGSDHLDLAEHPADALRRPTALTGHRVIPFAAIAIVRRA
ncbi:hypothetical protein HJ588_13285 [Flexivirga sp. ID2601S]|uniref:Uncharacterized protein n=1 Tax=Flexivirga aerilata TaxID=1656889 RepID=A0A849APJ9_9MICO|nr:hypothetical protein [Flexivirga aerilata]NNG40240.1 hypothetical protein [Flexivirga aerilata]